MGRTVRMLVVFAVSACIIAGYASYAPRGPVVPSVLASRIAPHVPNSEQAIPALPSLPPVEAPFWTLYVCSALILFVAVVMLRRCQQAGRCRCLRKPSATFHAPVKR